MTKRLLSRALVLFLVCLLALPATAQRRRRSYSNYSTEAPQYLIENVYVLLENSSNFADSLLRQQRYSITDTDLLSDQAERLVDDAEEALDLLDELMDNADATNPSAMPALREAEGNLNAAIDQAEGVLEYVDDGDLGPSMKIQARAAARYLGDAKEEIRRAAREYDVRLENTPERESKTKGLKK
jgi:hypothetical protein